MPAGHSLPGFALTRHAPAKINLALHVTGQRADGYHLIESLVTFADIGSDAADRIGMTPAATDRFTISGRFSKGLLQDADGADGNLVLSARDLVRQALAETGRIGGPVHLHLEKNLPIASGIGGGSADAAAVITGLNVLWNGGLAAETLTMRGLKLGADLPMCLAGVPLVAGGIGEHIRPVPGFPPLNLVLVNPLVHVATPAVFRSLDSKINPPLGLPDTAPDAGAWLEIITALRNDLEPPARRHAPEIAMVCGRLEAEGASLVRMSGSGATCFGIFETAKVAGAVAARLAMAEPGWYVAATQTTGSLP